MNTQSTFHWLTGCSRLRFWARLYAFADLVHLALPDFEQSGWGGAGVLIFTSSVLLMHRPYPAAFLLAATAHAWTLMGLRDVLTQSVLLLLFSLIGLAVAIHWRPRLFRAIANVTAVTYLAASIHKLNINFFDPEISCAVHASLQLSSHWGFSLPASLREITPYLAICMELSLWICLALRSRWFWLLALVFHLPLLVTLAPAFGIVMLCGATAMIDAKSLLRLKWLCEKNRLLIVIGLVVGVVVELSLSDGWVSWTQPAQVGVYIVGCSLLFSAMPVGNRTHASHWYIAWGWLMFCLTPYVGLQYQHTAAMLSNLRIDSGCHNSLLFPSALIEQDPYIRIEHARFGAANWTERARILEAGSWNEAAHFTMKKKWCKDWVRPIEMTVTYRGRNIGISDLCESGSMNFVPNAFHVFPQFQRFQKNLTRNCKQSCIH